MPVSEDSSIVPDSTLSPSPPATTPVVRRAVRTYGRPRVQDPAEDSDTSRFDTSFSSESRDRIYKTGPLTLDEEIPPSSDPQDDDEEENASQETPSAFQFSWKKQLQQLDEEEDFDMEPRAPKSRSTSPNSHEQEVQDAPTSPVRDDSSTLINDLFEGSLDTLTTSPSSRQSPLHNNASPDVGPVRRRSSKHSKRIVRDSDSEGEQRNEISPSPPLLTAPPRKHTSLTPPESDNELPDPVLPQPNSKSKGKAKARPQSTEVTDEEASPPSPAKRQRKVKDKAKKSKIKVSKCQSMSYFISEMLSRHRQRKNSKRLLGVVLGLLSIRRHPFLALKVQPKNTPSRVFCNTLRCKTFVLHPLIYLFH
jgi:mediator of replication checkpoint protein 1